MYPNQNVLLMWICVDLYRTEAASFFTERILIIERMILPIIFYVGCNKGFIEFKGLSRVKAFDKCIHKVEREKWTIAKKPLFLNIEHF